MRLGLTIRTLDGALRELSVVDGHFRDPDEPVDRELDTAGLWAVPGLADCHAHLSQVDSSSTGEEVSYDTVLANAWAQLEGGVFLVADKGTSDDVTLRVLDEPPTVRPEMHMAGRIITSPDGYFTDFGVEVDEVELVETVRAATGGGATWVKLIGDWPRPGVGAVTNFTEAAMHRATEVAHAAGCRVAIHTCAPGTPALAVSAGIDSIEHGLFLDGDDLERLGARGGAWVPTIAAMEAVRDTLGASSSGGRLFAEGLANVRELLEAAPRLGVTVLAGTDLEVPHGGVAAEALRLAHYGLPNEAVVHALTTAAYDYLGSDHSFAPGAHADVLFFDRDPRDDVSVLAEPVLGLRHGEIVVGGPAPAGSAR